MVAVGRCCGHDDFVKPHKLCIACVIAGVGLLALAISGFTDKRSTDEVRYDKLLSARRSEARHMSWRTKPLYRFLSNLVRFDPVSHYRGKADELEKALKKSGALIFVGFYPPSFLDSSATNAFAGQLFLSSDGFPYFASLQNSEVQYVNRFFGSKDDISLICRPRDVRYWQSAFCTITNRVRWGTLRKLGGNQEEIMCQLPDGTIVELDACQKWLNESIESGWMVGVCSSNRMLVASRQKFVIEAK